MNIFQLEERLKENPDSPLAARLAGQYLIRGKIGDAVRLSLQCIEQNPDYATPYIILGRCYATKQCYKEALICANKGFSIQPDSAIVKNLIFSWEKLSSKENLHSTSASISELPDINALQIILFKELSSEDVSVSQESETQENIQDVSEDKNIWKDNLEIGNKLEFSSDANLQIQEDSSVDSNKPLNEIKPVEEKIIVEFEKPTEMNLPPAIEAVMESIDFEGSNITNENELDITNGEVKQADNFIEKPEVDKVSTELNIEPVTLEHQVNEENINEVFEEYPEKEVPEVNILDSQEQTDVILNSTDIPFPEKVDSQLVESDGSDVSVQPTQKLEEISESDDLKIVSSEKKVISESNIREEDSKKSDQHIAKIFESAHETPRKEPSIDQTEFNHGPVPELPQIVSATLAEIYVRQGEYEEAIKTYRALIRLRPKQKEFFEKKIEELERKLRSQI